MGKRNLLTKILAIAGAVMVWLPILAPFVLGIVSLATDGVYRLDFLMPAELFPLVLIGGGLLYWADRRANSQQKLVGWSLILTVVFLISCQGLAVITGLASGEAEPAGFPLLAVTYLLACYILGVVAEGVGGFFLIKDLFKSQKVS
jgi:hypothetical protein